MSSTGFELKTEAKQLTTLNETGQTTYHYAMSGRTDIKNKRTLLWPDLKFSWVKTFCIIMRFENF
jgi:hypothetical protein